MHPILLGSGPLWRKFQGGLPSCGGNRADPASPFLWAIVNSACTDLSGWLLSDETHMVWNVDTPALNLGSASGTATNSFPLTFYDNLEALLTYTQDDQASVASWSGAVTLTATVTPEPATIGLIGLGLIVIGGVARRRRT